MIVELTLDSSILSHALQEAPDVTVRMEQLDASAAVPLRNLFWASGPSLDQFDAALDEDPTVRDWTLVASTDAGRLYRITYAPDLPDVAAYAAILELDGIVLNATNASEGYRVRIRFPDRESITAFRERCEAVGLPATVRAIYDRQPDAPGDEFGLTDSQTEVLQTALRLGYFEVPRGATLTEVAESLGISTQAASERLRRGTGTLVRNTVENGE